MAEVKIPDAAFRALAVSRARGDRRVSQGRAERVRPVGALRAVWIAASPRQLRRAGSVKAVRFIDYWHPILYCATVRRQPARDFLVRSAHFRGGQHGES